MTINRRPTHYISRREFLAAAGAVAIANAVPARSLAFPADLGAQNLFAYVGSWTGVANANSNGEGIYLFDYEAATGKLRNRRLAVQSPSPSCLAIHPSRKFLYAVNEVNDYRAQSGDPAGGQNENPTGSVSAFSIDAASGGLTPINTVSSEGAGPAHLSLGNTGDFAFVANYVGGSITVLPIHADGSLGAASDVHHDTGSVGSTKAAGAPAGSFAISGHDAPHAHMIVVDPHHRFVLSTDLGQDRIYVYRFDSVTGKLTPAAQPFIALPSGDGPRHIAFHPSGRWIYSIQEEASTVIVFAFDSASGLLTQRQMISTLPPGFAGTSFASEIVVSRDGEFLYAANRLADTIAVFAIDAAGLLTRVSECSTMGDYPSGFNIDPSGRFLFACNRRSDNITSFRIDPASGSLTFTGRYTPVGSPASIVFLAR